MTLGPKYIMLIFWKAFIINAEMYYLGFFAFLVFQCTFAVLLYFTFGILSATETPCPSKTRQWT